jgi:hypothetical protein
MRETSTHELVAPACLGSPSPGQRKMTVLSEH